MHNSQPRFRYINIKGLGIHYDLLLQSLHDPKIYVFKQCCFDNKETGGFMRSHTEAKKINGGSFWYANLREFFEFITRVYMDDITLCQLLQRVYQTHREVEIHQKAVHKLAEATLEEVEAGLIEEHQKAVNEVANAVYKMPELNPEINQKLFSYGNQYLVKYYVEAVKITEQDIYKNLVAKFLNQYKFDWENPDLIKRVFEKSVSE